jgi:hypothetical protein
VASPFASNVIRALREDAETEVQLTTRVGVLLAAGCTRRQVVERLGVEPREVPPVCRKTARGGSPRLDERL